MLEGSFVNHTGNPYCGKERSTDTDTECHGKTANRSGTEVVEDDGGDDRSEVRVEDGREGIAVTIGKGSLEVLTGAKFLLRTFVDKHVGVDSHTEREHQYLQYRSWSRQPGMKPAHQT